MDDEKGREAKEKKETLVGALLDSSLIQQTNDMKYNAKVIVCGNYVQLYLYDHYLIKKDRNLSPIYKNEKNIVVIDRKRSKEFKYYTIRHDNATR